MYIGFVLCVLIVFSLRRESLKLILVDEPLPEGILSQLESIRSLRRGRPKTAMGGLLLPRATPLLVPCTTRWKAPTIVALLLLPHTRRRLHQTTWWRCGWSAAPLPLLYAWWLLLLRHAWWLLLLWHTWRRFHLMTPPRTPRAMMNAPTSKRWAHLYELVLDFSCLVELLNVHTFILDWKVRKEIGGSRERISAYNAWTCML
jgi:hypothetical protein